MSPDTINKNAQSSYISEISLLTILTDVNDAPKPSLLKPWPAIAHSHQEKLEEANIEVHQYPDIPLVNYPSTRFSRSTQERATYKLPLNNLLQVVQPSFKIEERIRIPRTKQKGKFFNASQA